MSRRPQVPARAMRAARGGDLTAAECAPLARDLGGLPPMVVQVGNEEILLPDAVRLAVAARAAGVPVELRGWCRPRRPRSPPWARDWRPG